MTIRKGEEWGTRIVAPEQLILLPDDAHLVQMDSTATGVLTGGDIHYTLGSPPPVLSGADCTQLKVDAMQVLITLANGKVRTELAASCIEIGQFTPRIGRSSRYVCISNAGIVKGRNLAPRAHPNDGVLDVLEISQDISFRNRLQAYKRASTGTHIPHPDIRTNRHSECEYFNHGGNEVLRLDHAKIPSWQSIHITVLPDYWKIVV